MGSWLNKHHAFAAALLAVVIGAGLRIYGLPMDDVRWLLSPLAAVVGGEVANGFRKPAVEPKSKGK